MSKLFLASIVSNVMNRLLEFLPKSPKNMTVAFIPTAADPYEDKSFVEDDRKALLDAGFKLMEIDLKGKTKEELSEKFKNVDIIFVAGGNTFYLLQKIRESGFDDVVKDLIQKGVIYVGSSAGAILACPTIEHVKTLDDPSAAPGLESFDGLNLVDFLILPHFGKEKYMPKYKEVMKDFARYRIVTLTDQQAVIVEEDSYRIVSFKKYSS